MARGFLAAFAVIGALLAGPSSSQALTLVDPAGAPVGGKLQRWVDRAPVPFATGVVTVVQDTADGAWYDAAVRTVHISPNGISRGGFLHELGHDFEFTALSDTGWQTWARWMRYSVPRLQTVGTPETGRWQAREDFADWFAGCATRGLSLGVSDTTVTTSYGRLWNRKRFRRACARIWRLDASGAPVGTAS